MNSLDSVRDYEELLKKNNLDSAQAKEEQSKSIDKIIRELKEVKERFFKEYLEGEISFIEYKEKIHFFFKGENPEKIIAKLHKRKTFEEKSFNEEVSPKKLILEKNLKKRRTNTIIVSVAIIMLVVLSSTLLFNSKNSGITGFFASDQNIDTAITPEQTQETDIIDETEMDEIFPNEDIENPKTNTEQIQIDPQATPELIENQLIESEPDLEEQNQTVNESYNQYNNPIIETYIGDDGNDINNDQETEQKNADNEPELIGDPNEGDLESDLENNTEPEISLDTPEPNESIESQLNQSIPKINESVTDYDSDPNNLDSVINQTQESDNNQTEQTSSDNQPSEEISNSTEIENTTIDLNQTLSDATQNQSQILNETQTGENVTITKINQTGIVYSTFAIRNEITHLNLSTFSDNNATFLAIGTNNTAIVVVNDILEVSPIYDVNNDLIKIKEYKEGIILEFLLNITFVDRETYLQSIRTTEDINQTVQENETVITNQSLQNLSDILNETQESQDVKKYISPITLIPYQSIEIDLIEATNAPINNNGFLETSIKGISTQINNNTLRLSYIEPNQTQNFFEIMKIYLIKEEGVEVFYLNITLRTTGIFKSKIDPIKTSNKTIYVNALDFMQGDICRIECMNNMIEVVDLGNCNFLIENSRPIPTIDYCYLESLFEGENVRQYFDVSLSIEEINLIETEVVMENLSQGFSEEVEYSKELSMPIEFNEARSIIINENQQVVSFSTIIEPDYYEIVLLYEEDINGHNYSIAKTAEEIDLSENGFGITGAFMGATRVFGSIASFLTDIIMAIINFFSGGITGRATQEIVENLSEQSPLENSSSDLLSNENANLESDEEINEEKASITHGINSDESVTGIENNAFVQPVNSEEENIEPVIEETNSDDVINDENINDNLENGANNNTFENIIQYENLNISQDQTDQNESSEIVDLENNTYLENQNSIIENLTNITNESSANSEAGEQIGDNYTENVNGSIQIGSNLSTENTNEIQEIFNETEALDILSPALEVSEQTEIQEPIFFDNETNQTEIIINEIKEKLSTAIESLNIYSRYDGRNKTIVVYYTGNLSIEDLDASKIKIGVRYFANKINYTQNVTSANEFVDQYVISIKNPYLFDFDAMQLTIPLNTTKRKFYSKGHFATLISQSESERIVLLNNINIQRGSESIILLEASSPTFEFERSDLGELTTVNIFNYSLGELEIVFSNYDDEIEISPLFECNNSPLYLELQGQNSYKINLESCVDSNLTITINKKESKGMYVRLLGYYTYIDLSSVILKTPENIFLRSDCDDCIVESLCNPITFCPQSNVGNKEWNFVTDLEYNISDAQDILLNSAIKSAEICLYNIYSGNINSNTLSLGFATQTNCSALNLEKDVKNLLSKQTSKEFSTAPELMETGQNSNVSGWVCIDIKDATLEYILSGNEIFVIRVIGSDLTGEKGSFACFDSGLIPNKKCSEFGIKGCSPYLNITYEYLD